MYEHVTRDGARDATVRGMPKPLRHPATIVPELRREIVEPLVVHDAIRVEAGGVEMLHFRLRTRLILRFRRTKAALWRKHEPAIEIPRSVH